MQKAACSPVVLLALVAALVAGPGRAEDEESNVKLGGLLDARLALTGHTTSWLDEGLGKTRYGAVGGDAATLARLAGASLYVAGDLDPALSIRVHVSLDAEPDPAGKRGGRVDLVEAFAAYHPDLTAHIGLRTRAGFFFPPISLEHRGPAWATHYTITPSAANTWVGEELRSAGAEAGLLFRLGDRHTVTLLGAGFGSNDPAGSLLAWRGWALHDRLTRAWDHVPLPPIPAFKPGGAFSRQAQWVGPFREIDGRIGYYAGGRWSTGGLLEVDGLYYANRGIPTAFDGWQYAWQTSFTNVGLRLKPVKGFELLGQYMDGTTYMGRGTKEVEARYWTAYGLASLSIGRHRLSARYERFEVQDRDTLGSLDDNNENGEAWTGAYVFETEKGHRLALEVLQVKSDRPARATLDLPTHADETLVQVSLRFVF